MDSIRLPPIDPVHSRAGATPAPSAATAQPDAVVAPADRVDIHPLDVAGALQILIAEVRAELALPVDTLPGDALSVAGAAADLNLGNAPQALVQMVLQALPDVTPLAPLEWLSATTRVQTGTLNALDKGVAAVANWRNVAPPVLDAAREMRTMVAAALLDDPPNPLWLQPEWLGLAPRMERFWRRRRYVRRQPIDPDLGPYGTAADVEVEPLPSPRAQDDPANE